MDIRVDSQATVDGVVQGRPSLPEGQNQPSPSPSYQLPRDSVLFDKDLLIIPASSSEGSF